MMHNMRMSVVIILFFHFSQGELNFLIDGSTIELNENVVLQCQDTSKSRSIAFSYKSETGTIFNNFVSCVMTRPCTISDSIKYSSQKDETNAAFNEFNATIKSFSNSSFGCYRCQDLTDTSVYSEHCIPYNASLTEKCSSIIKCGDSNVECTGTICQCKSSFTASGSVCIPMLLIWIVTILMGVNWVWSVIMDILLTECKGCKEDWCLALNNITLCRSFISTVVKIFLCVVEKEFMFAATDPVGMKNLAFVLLITDLIPYTLGLSCVVWRVCCAYGPSIPSKIECKCSNNGEETIGVSKPKEEISKANQQPRESEAVSSDGIELAVVNNGQEKPMLRPQPPLSGIGKSHQQVDEPHHKKTRGLSSNFEDPNSLPQKEVRKDSLAPMIENMEGDSDSNSKEKEDEKEEKRGK